MAAPTIASAAQFLAAEARVLERRLFERLFQDGERRSVRDAVAAYRNPDGGFGQGLEPDGRTPSSQPAAVEMALRILDLADAFDDDLVVGACDWLESSAPPEGGSVFVEPTVEGWPHAPWWQSSSERVASLAMTGQIAGTLLRRRVRHPWLRRASELLWNRIAELEEAGPYDLRGAIQFLESVEDRKRAEAVFQRVAALLQEPGLVEMDPEAPGEVHFPLEYAPRPDSLARRLFDPAQIERHLVHLEASQKDDGGWDFNWLAWSPAAAREWRGFVTVETLNVLRVNGRI